MKNPIFLTFLFILILCVSQASATTVQNSKYLNTLSAGDSDIFEMKLTADTKNEIGLKLTITKEGDCEFIEVNKEKILISDIPQSVTASIKIPTGSINGLHKCEIMFTAPSNGMATARIGVPFLITVTNGVNATPTPTITTLPLTTAPTTAPKLEQHTLGAPEPEPTTTQMPTPSPTIIQYQIWLIYGLIAYLIIAVGAVLIWEYQKEKKPSTLTSNNSTTEKTTSKRGFMPCLYCSSE